MLGPVIQERHIRGGGPLLLYVHNEIFSCYIPLNETRGGYRIWTLKRKERWQMLS